MVEQVERRARLVAAGGVQDVVQQRHGERAVGGQVDLEQRRSVTRLHRRQVGSEMRDRSGQDMRAGVPRQRNPLGSDRHERPVEVREVDRSGVAAEVDADGAVEHGFGPARRARPDGRVDVADSARRVAARKTIVIDARNRIGRARNRVRQQRDRHRRDRRVAVAVGDPVLERNGALFARARRVGEGAVVVVDQSARSAERSRDQGNARGQADAVGARDVVGDDVDGNRKVLARLCSAVVMRGRHVVDDVDDQAGGRGVAVAVGDLDREGVGRRIARWCCRASV